MHNPFNLQDKIILVTGASSGIGKAIATECSRMGATLIITGRNESRLKATLVSLQGNGHKLIMADLGNRDELNNLAAELNSLDGIVHCAGITDPVPFQFINESKLNEIMKINFTSPTLLTQKLINRKCINKGASIVFISSISGVYCSAVAASMYSSSKGAVNGLVKGMALDLASKNIRVNSICPGMIETDIFHNGQITTEQMEEDKGRYPLKRYGKPEEVAYAAIYLLSDASLWITGSDILIDGGYTLL